MKRKGSTSGIDMLAAQMEALRALLAERDAELAALRDQTFEAQAELRASEQEGAALMAGIANSAKATRSHAAVALIDARRVCPAPRGNTLL